jgi:hypothetical protein
MLYRQVLCDVERSVAVEYGKRPAAGSVLPDDYEHVYQGDYRQAEMPQGGIDVFGALVGLLRADGNQVQKGGEQQHSSSLIGVGVLKINGLWGKRVIGFTFVKR